MDDCKHCAEKNQLLMKALQNNEKLLEINRVAVDRLSTLAAALEQSFKKDEK